MQYPCNKSTFFRFQKWEPVVNSPILQLVKWLTIWEKAQCKSVIYSLVLKAETDRVRNKQIQPWWDLPSGQLQGFVCICSKEGLCTCSRVYDSHDPIALKSTVGENVWEVIVCFVVYYRCTSAVSSHLCASLRRLLTPLPHFTPTLEYSDFEHSPAALWRLSQYWLTLPLNTSKPQSETAFCGQSQHNIKVEQIVKCIWGVWFTQIYFSTACVHLEQSNTLHYHVFSNLFNMAIRPYFPFIPINTFLWCHVYLSSFNFSAFSLSVGSVYCSLLFSL